MNCRLFYAAACTSSAVRVSRSVNLSPSVSEVTDARVRAQTYYDAICYVETHADEHIRESFQESASITDSITLYELLAARLTRFFKETYDKDFEQELKEIEKTYSFWKDKSSSILFEEKNELVMSFIRDYRKAFLSLVKDFHHPSKLINSVTTIINKVN